MMAKKKKTRTPPKLGVIDGGASSTQVDTSTQVDKTKKPRTKKPKERTSEQIEVENFNPDAAFKRLMTETKLKNPETKRMLCAEAVVLHERILEMRAMSSIGRLTADEARSMPGLQGKLLLTYRMLRVDEATEEEDPL